MPFLLFSSFSHEKKGSKPSFAISLHQKIALTLVNRPVVFFSFYFTEKRKIIGSPRRGTCAVFLPVLITLDALFVARTHLNTRRLTFPQALLLVLCPVLSGRNLFQRFTSAGTQKQVLCRCDARRGYKCAFSKISTRPPSVQRHGSVVFHFLST